jgi:hypothetical protein
MKHRMLLATLMAGFCGRLLAQTELGTNGGFEFGLSGWQTQGAGISISNTPVHSGSACVSITTSTTSESVVQDIIVPTNTALASLSYWYNIYSIDGAGFPNAALSVYIGNAAGHQLATVDTKYNTDRDFGVQGRFHQVTFDVTPYIKTNAHLQVQFLVSSATAGGTQFNLDDVSVLAVDSTARGPNDNFAFADLLTGASVSVTTSNTFATKEPGEPNHAGNPGGHSLWWRWTAPASGVVTLTTDGSNFDTLLAAYTGTVVSNLTRVTANDDDNGGLSMTSLIRFPVNAGTEYKLAVDGANGGSGTVQLSLSFVPDTKGPTVAFTSPGAGASVTNSIVTVQGTAKDNVLVSLVEYRLENASGTNDYQAAVGTNRWSATVTNLIPGVNTVRVRAWDTSTNVSPAVARAFYYDIFSPAKGVYAGLFSDTNTLNSTNAGFFSASIAAKGKFSAKLLLAGRTYPFSGQFGFDSTFSKTILRPNQEALNVQLAVDLLGGDIITGSVSNSAWLAPLSANRSVFSRAHPALQSSRKYTLVIQGGEDVAAQPTGYGFGTVKEDTLGNVSFSGTLADGTRVSQRTFLSKRGEWPFYLSPSAGKQLMTGWVGFSNDLVSDFSGPVTWAKQPQPTKLYPNGFSFTNQLAVVGSLYTFTNGVPLLGLPNGGNIQLDGANLSQSVSYPFSLDSRNKILGTNKVTVTLSTGTGLFRGSVPNPDTSKPIPVSGALLLKQNAGFGSFLGTNQTGRVTLGE